MKLLYVIFVILLAWCLWKVCCYTRPHFVDNILSEEEAKYIIEQAKPKLKKSGLVSSNRHDDKVRNSQTAWVSKDDPKIKEIIQRILQIKGLEFPIENCESLQVVKYEPGQYYKPHQDSCCKFTSACWKHNRRGGHRIRTVILGLNEGYEGGTTSFPNLDVKLKVPYRGGLVFRPLNDAGNWCHPYALHGGDPVERGEKWIANLWIHERKFV